MAAEKGAAWNLLGKQICSGLCSAHDARYSWEDSLALCLLWCPLLNLEKSAQEKLQVRMTLENWWKTGNHAVESLVGPLPIPAMCRSPGRTEWCGTGRNSAGRALVQKGLDKVLVHEGVSSELETVTGRATSAGAEWRGWPENVRVNWKS